MTDGARVTDDASGADDAGVVDLSFDAVRDDPYPAYARLREAGSAVYEPRLETWCVGRHADAAEVLRDGATFANLRSGMEPSLTGADGPEHQRVRRLVQTAFDGRMVQGVAERLPTLVDELLGAFFARGGGDLVTEVIERIPGTVMCWVLGIDPERVADVQRWTPAISEHGHRRRARLPRGLLARLLGRPPRRRGKRRPPPDDAFEECLAFLGEHFDGALGRPTGGFVADVLTEHRRRGELSRDVLMDVGLVMFLAGTETTVDWMGNGALALLGDPALERRLRDEPRLLEPFGEEILRHDSPVQRRPRLTTREARLGDAVIPAGVRVEVFIGAANRDPRAYPDPDRVDPERFVPGRLVDGRPVTPHLSFAPGPHLCLGAALTRAEMRAFLTGLLARPSLVRTDPDAPIEYPRHCQVRGPRRLPVAVG